MPINVTDEKGKIIAGPKKGGDDTEREKGLKKSKMLIGGQAKLDKNKNNKIDAEDFAMLRREKSPMKAKRGRLAGQDFSERMKNVERGLINKKTGKPVSMDAMRKLKGFKTGELPKDFVKRRMALAGVKEAAKKTRIGKIALGIAGAGLAAKALLDKKRKETKEEKKNKKMGGGLAAATERLKAQGKMGGGMMKPQKAVLGMLFRKKRRKATPGMKMVQSSPGGFGLLGRLAKKVGLSKGGGADTGRVGEMKSRVTVGADRIRRQRENLRKRIKGTPTFTKLTEADKKKIKGLGNVAGPAPKFSRPSPKPQPVQSRMGGGMMQPAMPMYKKGKMIKARGGGLAKTKPTKMY